VWESRSPREGARVVDLFPAPKPGVERVDRPVGRDHLLKPLVVRSIRTLDMAIQLGSNGVGARTVPGSRTRAFLDVLSASFPV
jgi:hypothetical protein